MPKDRMPVLIVVSGPPGAGKTTVAEALADRLELPLLAKDAIKELLADALGVAGNRAASQRLGGATFALQFHVLGELLSRGVSTIAEGNFRRAEEFLALPPARVLEVYVSAPPELLRTRLASRSTRHPVHYDVEAADEIGARAASGEWRPLALGGALIEIDTAVFPDVDAVAERVAAAVR